MEPLLLERLKRQLRRDPSDREAAYLVAVAARHPRRLYESDRRRLGALILATSAMTERAQLFADAARWILEQATADE